MTNNAHPSTLPPDTQDKLAKSLRAGTLQLNLGWLYPTLMSTYGDRGNIMVLQKIAEYNGIKLNIISLDQTLNSPTLLASENVAGRQLSTFNSLDLIFMGGAQDLQQEIVMRDLLGKKGEILRQKIENETPGLFICGAYQFLGNYYKDSYGTKIKGLGIFDMYTESFKNEKRLTGNIVVKAVIPFPLMLKNNGNQTSSQKLNAKNYLVGFENHGGRTFLKDTDQAFAKVVVGFGNNGEDKTEGIFYKNSIGTYLHGPILPSNPELAVFLLEKAIEKKYKEEKKLTFNDEISRKAKMVILKRLKTQY